MTHSNGASAAPPGGQPDEPAGNVPLAMVEELITAAILAPSMHNTQPWQFRFDPGCQTIELYADPARMLRFGDPDGRAVHIACGAALLNLRLAAIVAGRQPLVRLIPTVTQRLLLATVRLAGPCQPQPDEIELRAAIPARRTNRSPFSGQPVPPGILAELAEAARREGAVLHFPDYQEAVRLLGLARQAERQLMAHRGYRAELARWAGGARDREGIPDAALAPHDPAGAAPVRDFAVAQPRPVHYAWFEERPQLAVLATPSCSRSDWLRAGQALQRVLLTATLRGIAASPLTQPLETPDAWLVRDPQSSFEYPQMILRFGYGLPVPHTPRRPVSEVLDTIHTQPAD
ncbi:MAG TPA: nitroreductase family protein [Streptosporangiaceae bacterium]|jgi:nitroreductase